ncbi:MAG: nickel-dependent lactate racemase [Tissierellia bacterium]|nr:nickel-dependent lactate racemase [Tissierellia bacterium]MDD4439256.1 nickel-dependent lactate racemase [Tissierellia bacterium]
MKLKIGFGSTPQELNVPDNLVMDILKANEVEIGLTGVDEVKRSLKSPIGTARLKDIVKSGEKIVIVTSDITRPVPSYKILPSILDEIYEAGVNKEDIVVVLALGSHRTHTDEEKIKLVGQKVYNEVKCIDSDLNDCVRMGVTKAGTPVDIFRVVAEADRRICVGNIEYHYFAGYSGGAKAIMPGVSTPSAIQANHSKMIFNDAKAGKLEGNPVREDLEEAIAFCPIDFIVNVVLDEKKEIIYAVAGDYIKAHREGCKFLDKIYKIELKEKADIIIVSQGGAPKDLNLYQTQKALDNAKHAIKDGGIIILVGSCKEGLGSQIFEEWMTEANTPDDLITRIRQNFRLGGHKAAAIALILKKARIFMVSEMEHELVKSIFMEPYDTVQEAYNDAIKELGDDVKVLIMPYGGSTLPVIND